MAPQNLWPLAVNKKNQGARQVGVPKCLNFILRQFPFVASCVNIDTWFTKN